MNKENGGMPVMGYYSTLKKKDFCHATTWMNLEHNILSEIKQNSHRRTNTT